MTVPAGWYPDPGAPGRLRYHDGTAWTAHTATRSAPAPEPSPVPAAVGAVGAVGAPRAVAPPRPGAAPSSPSAMAPAPPVLMPIGVDGPVAADSSPTVIPDRVIDPRAERPRRRWLLIGAAGGVLLLAVGAWAVLVDHRPSGAEAAEQAFAAQSASRVVDAKAAASLLKGFATPMKPPLGWMLMPKTGASLTKPSFAELCGLPASVDSARIARRQWLLTASGKAQPLTVEAVAYRSVADATTAMADVRTALGRCVKGVTKGKGSSASTTRAVEVRAVTPPVVSAQGLTTSLVRSGRIAGTAARKAWITGTIQQRGQFISSVWILSGKPPTLEERTILDQFAYRQAVALAKTPLP